MAEKHGLPCVFFVYASTPSRTGIGYVHAVPVSAFRVTVFVNAVFVRAFRITVFGNAVPVSAFRVTVFGKAVPVSAFRVTLFGKGVPVSAFRVTVFGRAVPVSAFRVTVFGNAVCVSAFCVTLFGKAVPVSAFRFTVFGKAVPVSASRVTVFGNALPVSAFFPMVAARACIPGSSPFNQLNLRQTDETKRRVHETATLTSRARPMKNEPNQKIIQTDYPPRSKEAKTRRPFRSQVIDRGLGEQWHDMLSTFCRYQCPREMLAVGEC